MTELKPCPFCGRKVKIEIGGLVGINMILCDKCGATVSFYRKEQRQKVIEAWNRRVNEDVD